MAWSSSESPATTTTPKKRESCGKGRLVDPQGRHRRPRGQARPHPRLDGYAFVCGARQGKPDRTVLSPHGAGRRFSRTKAKELFSEADVAKAMEGIEYRH